MIYRSTIVLSLLIGAISPVAAQNNGITEPPPPPTTQQETFTSETPASDVLVRAYIPDDIQRLLPGDIIKFFVIEDEEPAQILRVKENGYVDFPYIGHVDVKGRTPKQVCDILKYELEKNYYYEATVFIGVEQSTRVRGTVQIMGAVDHPSEMQIPANTIFRLSNVMLTAQPRKAKRPLKLMRAPFSKKAQLKTISSLWMAIVL